MLYRMLLLVLLFCNPEHRLPFSAHMQAVLAELFVISLRPIRQVPGHRLKQAITASFLFPDDPAVRRCMTNTVEKVSLNRFFSKSLSFCRSVYTAAPLPVTLKCCVPKSVLGHGFQPEVTSKWPHPARGLVRHFQNIFYHHVHKPCNKYV
jgi:hypothetical protein